MFKLVLEKAEEAEIKLPTSTGSWEKQESSGYGFSSGHVWMWELDCEKFLKRWKYQTTLSVFQETCMQVKKQQLEPDMEQQTGSK